MLSAVYAMAVPSVRLFVHPSVTRVLCIKTAERIMEILSPSDRPIILVFHHQGLLRKSDGFTPNGGGEYNGDSDFRDRRSNGAISIVGPNSIGM